MNVAMYFDPYASLDSTQEEEYAEAQELFKENVPGTHRFKENIFPHQLRQNPADVYLFDIGGMGANFGAHDTVWSHIRTLAELVEEMPSTLFVLWSSFTCRWYEDLIKDEYPELVGKPNTLMRYLGDYHFDENKKFWTAIKKWAKP